MKLIARWSQGFSRSFRPRTAIERSPSPKVTPLSLRPAKLFATATSGDHFAFVVVSAVVG